MRPNSAIRRLESIDYVIEDNVIYPELFMTEEQYEKVIDEYLRPDGDVDFKILPVVGRR